MAEWGVGGQGVRSLPKHFYPFSIPIDHRTRASPCPFLRNDSGTLFHFSFTFLFIQIDDIVLDIVGGMKQELVLTAAADVTANNSVSAELLAIADEPIVSSPSTSIGIATTTRNSLLHTSFITAARNVRLMDADESIQCAITSAHDESTEMKVNDVRVQQQAIDDCISSTFVDARNKRKYVEVIIVITII